MKIYANIIGKWIELNDEEYIIDGAVPSNMFEKIIDPETINVKTNNVFFLIENVKTNFKCQIHYSQLQKVDCKDKKWLY